MTERTDRPSVDVVVVSWNGRALLPSCLTSLRRQTLPPRQVIVVDNGSDDGSAALVRADYPGVVLIERADNLGFAGGANVGLRHALAAGAEYVALLNQDAEAEPEWLAALVRAAAGDPDVGAVSSRILLASPRTVLNSTGIELNRAGRCWDRGIGRVDGPRWRAPDETLGASGGAMLLRAAALRRAGLFDEAYFAYYEDLDLSVRLWEQGYRIRYAPDAVAYHRLSASFGEGSYPKLRLIHSNRLRFLLKHFPVQRLLRDTIPFAVHELRTLLSQASPGGRRWLRLCLSCYPRAAAGLPSVLAYRWRRGVDPAARQRWWRFLRQAEYGYPDIFVPIPDYACRADAGDPAGDRFLAGAVEDTLGEGWYPRGEAVSRLRLRFPRPVCRGFGRTATCYLGAAAPGRHRLELLVAHPYPGLRPVHLRVACAGAEIGATRVAADPQWRVLRFPVDLDGAADAVAVALTVDDPILREESAGPADVGLLVNAIRLLPDESPAG